MTVPPVLLKGDDLFEDDSGLDPYENTRDISKYLLMHYGHIDDVFERPHHPLATAHGYPQRLSALLELCALRGGTRVRRALDVGCSVGGVSHALGGWVAESVTGIDISPRSVDVAQTLNRHGCGTFHVVQQGPFAREVHIRVPAPGDGRARVAFEVGDACALGLVGEAVRDVDAVVLSNVLDRVADPEACLRQFTDSDAFLRPGGLLMVACPWSWYPAYSAPERWLGASSDRTPSEEAVKDVLGTAFELLAESDEGAVLRQNPREYDYFEAHVTVWRKR
ncbi:methyltransferase domain-containing protein [Streptomyces sp. NPDC014734]|uniref:methyltransferase domain-containing protein n=1 Tax=Streptomyces sp. NPDC014734 TaxID=3364886 RepID=UPI0036FFF0BB